VVVTNNLIVSQIEQHSLQKTVWLLPKIPLTMAICY